jgi:NAD-dependent DNA ligase
VAGIKKTRPLIDELLKYVHITEATVATTPVVKDPATYGSRLNGAFCFTGAINKVGPDGKRFTRNMMWEVVKANGGVVHEEVRGGTSFLVQVDPSSQSSKSKKASKLGVKIISEADFFKMVEE